MAWSHLLAACLALVGIQSPAFGPAAASPPPVDGPRIRYGSGVSIPTPEGPRRVTSLLRVPGAMRYGDFAWRDAGASPGPVWVRVDLKRQTVSAFSGGDEIGTAVILFGTDGKPTPRGAFRVLERDRDHRSSLYDAAMPFMLRLTSDGVAIHASAVRSGSATHGCIGVPAGFAERLYARMRRGDPVYVV